MPASLRGQGHDGDAAPCRFSISFCPEDVAILWPCPPQAPGGAGQSPAHLGRTGFRDSDPAFAHGAGVLAGRQPQVGLDLVGAFESVDAILPAPRQSGPPSPGPTPGVVISSRQMGSASAICSSSWSAKAICTLSVSRLTRVARPIKGQPSGCLLQHLSNSARKGLGLSSGDPDQLGAQITAHAVDQLGPRADQRFPQGAEGASLPRHLGGDVDRRKIDPAGDLCSVIWASLASVLVLREPTPRTSAPGSPAPLRTSWPAASAPSATLNASAQVSKNTRINSRPFRNLNRDPSSCAFLPSSCSDPSGSRTQTCDSIPTQIDGNVFHGWFSFLCASSALFSCGVHSDDRV